MSQQDKIRESLFISLAGILPEWENRSLVGRWEERWGQESQVSPAARVEAVGGRTSVPRSPAVSLGIPQLSLRRGAAICHLALAHKSSSTPSVSSTSSSGGRVSGAGGNHIFLWQLHSSTGKENLTGNILVRINGPF